MAVAAIGILLLETINYIEHYGLRRRLLDSGRPEPVGPHHSWNSNHELGRIFLYELTRHLYAKRYFQGKTLLLAEDFCRFVSEMP